MQECFSFAAFSTAYEHAVAWMHASTAFPRAKLIARVLLISVCILCVHATVSIPAQAKQHTYTHFSSCTGRQAMSSLTPPHSGPSLLQLPDDVISCVFEQLPGQDRRLLLHTCKALHSSDACLSKVCDGSPFVCPSTVSIRLKCKDKRANACTHARTSANVVETPASLMRQ